MDESGTDRAFAGFLAALRSAAQAENSLALRGLCAEDMITGIDTAPGPAEFLRQMRAGDWRALREVMRFGAGKYGADFVIPYLFARFPEDLEPTEHVVTVRAGAVLRAERHARARVVCALDYDILQTGDARPVDGWIKVKRLDGFTGWVAQEDVRSLGAPRLFAGKRQGTWKVTAWASGE